jgi:RNA polymerase sigma factor (TIGR02999 family)
VQPPLAPRPSAEGVTDLLQAWSQGNEAALERLIPIVHLELRRLARRQMRRERDGHTLQTTALVNEVYVRLVDLSRVRWQDRTHFFAMSSRLMRRVLVDHARSRRYLKRGGGTVRVTLNPELALATGRGTDLVALDDALTALAAKDPRKSRVVELRFFGGLSVAETAETLGVSEETVMRDWRMAKAWLHKELSRVD